MPVSAPAGATLVLTLWLAPAVALAAPRAEAPVDEYTDRYDDEFRKWSKRYFGPTFDWRWFKAQGVVESSLKPGASGKSGVGIMQLLPSTYARIRRENPTFGAIHDPRWNIAAGIFYNRQNFEIWSPLMAHMEALRFTLASYNAGPGRIRQSYEKVKKKTGQEVGRWTLVEKQAPRITRHYVRKVHQLMGTEVHAPSEGADPALPPRG
ncbi:MAG: transglycosylase SLT domain-containing protein [Gammaproteobacteria bacterium]|jgi:membrane-bound lytic murein transglycosylase F|nr:transglycosylase SLT domain-containing protein [Gammaproteobacteria bacterium]